MAENDKPWGINSRHKKKDKGPVLLPFAYRVGVVLQIADGRLPRRRHRTSRRGLPSLTAVRHESVTAISVPQGPPVLLSIAYPDNARCRVAPVSRVR
jgi:hypothetical protein